VSPCSNNPDHKSLNSKLSPFGRGILLQDILWKIKDRADAHLEVVVILTNLLVQTLIVLRYCRRCVFVDGAMLGILFY
jgi:hypothetical protein